MRVYFFLTIIYQNTSILTFELFDNNHDWWIFRKIIIEEFHAKNTDKTKKKIGILIKVEY